MKILLIIVLLINAIWIIYLEIENANLRELLQQANKDAKNNKIRKREK